MSINALYMEHRWGTRVEMFTPADVTTASGRSYKAVVRNASLSGAYLATLAHLPVQSRIVLKPLVPGADWIDACIVRTDGRGAGIEWMEPALRSVSTLLAMRNEGLDFDHSPRLQRDPVSWQLLDRLHPSLAACGKAVSAGCDAVDRTR
jgi:hypothetical protein